jgi:F-type H+-transporting ATPase subunit gamma
MSAVMGNLASGAGKSDSAPKLISGTGRSDVHLLIVATAERGLCGGFNSSIVRLAKSHIEKLQSVGSKVKIITVGKKGREQLKREFSELIINHVDLSDVKRISYNNAKSISDDIVGRFEANEFDVCTIFYNEFKSVISQIPTALQLIPAVFEETEDVGGDFYDYEPDENEILTELLPRAMTTNIFTALLENGASEQGARMSAMDNATRNAGDMIDKLTIEYNRSRQAVITNELIEIISGAEAL